MFYSTKKKRGKGTHIIKIILINIILLSFELRKKKDIAYQLLKNAFLKIVVKLSVIQNVSAGLIK